MTTRIDAENGSLVFYSPYNSGLVADLKSSIPASSRKWDNFRKAWIIDPAYGRKLVRLAAEYCNEIISLPKMDTSKSVSEQRILEVRYVGMTKDRGDGESSSFGWTNIGGWSVVFPENILREWFNAGDIKPGEEITLFGVLGVKQEATPEEIKTAYRRMAKQWHPDVCREPDAAEQFKRINESYQILSDTIKRAKYEAGLKLQASIGSTAKDRFRASLHDSLIGYRPPLRCGLILAVGTERLGRFCIEKIEQWTDITDRQGRTLVTSWPMGADKPVETWA